LILSRVPVRSEVGGTPLDAEAIRAVASHHDLEVFVDLDGDGPQQLRDAGLMVRLSDKRGVFLHEDGRVLPDRAVVAASVAASHEEEPFDALVYGEDVPVDLAWYDRRLADVPRGIAVGDGPIADHRLVFDHPGLSEFFAAEVWRATGMIGTADFVVADAPPAAFGLRDRCPPWFTWDSGPLELADPPDAPPRLVAVVALAERRTGYGSLVDRVMAALPTGPETVIAAVVPDVLVGAETTGRLVAAGCPAGFELNVVVAHPGTDGLAAGMIETADVVVAARPTDAAVGAVRSAAAPVVPLFVERDAPAGRLVDGEIPSRRERGDRIMVRIDGEPGDVVAPAEVAFGEGVEHVVFHTNDATATAVEVMGMPHLEGADLVVVGAPQGVYGEPGFRPIAPGVLGVSRRTWPTMRRRMTSTHSLWESMVWMLGLSSVEHATLAVVPGVSDRWEPLPIANVTGIPSFLSSWGLVGRPDLASVGPAPASHGDQRPVPESTIVRRWVMQRTWSQRIRLALPARFGWLRRAMKGRW
jgi:hypothetical protein